MQFFEQVYNFATRWYLLIEAWPRPAQLGLGIVLLAVASIAGLMARSAKSGLLRLVCAVVAGLAGVALTLFILYSVNTWVAGLPSLLPDVKMSIPA